MSEKDKGTRQTEITSGPNGWKLRTSSTEGDNTVWLFVPGMWHTDSFATFGVWPRFVAKQDKTASATLVLRGRSTVSGPEGSENFSTLNDYVDDVREVFMHLARRFDRIILCGHSMGGLLVHLTTQSLHEAIRDKLCAVVTLCESTSIVPRMAWNALTSRSISEILAGEPFRPHPKDVEKYILKAGWDLSADPVFDYESGVAARQLLLRHFRLDFTSPQRPRVPHLVVGSINDPIVPCLATAKTYHRMIRAGINAHYLTVVPGGHMIMLCRAAENTVAMIFTIINHHIVEAEKSPTTRILYTRTSVYNKRELA